MHPTITALITGLPNELDRHHVLKELQPTPESLEQFSKETLAIIFPLQQVGASTEKINAYIIKAFEKFIVEFYFTELKKYHEQALSKHPFSVTAQKTYIDWIKDHIGVQLPYLENFDKGKIIEYHPIRNKAGVITGWEWKNHTTLKLQSCPTTALYTDTIELINETSHLPNIDQIEKSLTKKLKTISQPPDINRYLQRKSAYEKTIKQQAAVIQQLGIETAAINAYTTKLYEKLLKNFYFSLLILANKTSPSIRPQFSDYLNAIREWIKEQPYMATELPQLDQFKFSDKLRFDSKKDANGFVAYWRWQNNDSKEKTTGDPLNPSVYNATLETAKKTYSQALALSDQNTKLILKSATEFDFTFTAPKPANKPSAPKTDKSSPASILKPSSPKTPEKPSSPSSSPVSKKKTAHFDTKEPDLKKEKSLHFNFNIASKRKPDVDDDSSDKTTSNRPLKSPKK